MLCMYLHIFLMPKWLAFKPFEALMTWSVNTQSTLSIKLKMKQKDIESWHLKKIPLLPCVGYSLLYLSEVLGPEDCRVSDHKALVA